MAIYGSSRRGANSEILAEHLLRDLPATRLYLYEQPVAPITDLRHDPKGFPPVPEEYGRMITQMLEHDILLFVTPLYWYGMSGAMKNFVDSFSHALRDPRLGFKERIREKEGYAVIVGGDQVRRKAIPLVEQFGLIFDFLGMKYGGYLIGQGGKPGDIMADSRALQDAAALNQSLRARIS